MALRDLLVAFKVDVDAKALDNVDKKINGVLATAQKFGSYLLTGLAGNVIVNAIQGQLNYADTLGATADKLGIAADELERWQYIAKLSDASQEGMAASLGFLNKALGQAAEGSKEPLTAFQALGIAVKNSDGTLRGTGDVMQEIAAKWSTLGSAGEKTTTAMRLFGRAGAQLIPLLNGGVEAIQSHADAFEELGGATPDAFLQLSSDTNDELDRMRRATKMLSLQILSSLVPAYRWLIERMTHTINAIRKFDKETGAIKRGLAALALGGVALLAARLVKLASNAGTVAKAMKAIFGIGPMGLLVIAIVGALYLLFEDLFVLLEGGESTIGAVMTALLGPEEAKAFVDSMRAAWADLQGTFTEIGPDLAKIASVLGMLFAKILPLGISAFAGLTELAVGLVEIVAGVVKAIIALGKAFATAIKGNYGGDDLLAEIDKQSEGARKLLERGAKTAGAGLGVVGKGVYAATTGERYADGSVVPQAQRVQLPPSAVPAPAPAGNVDNSKTIEQRNQVTNVFNVDPAKIRDGVKAGTSDILADGLKSINEMAGAQ